ncbi:TPA: hypothetical protein ACW7KW_005203 [Serratia liquefaciens]
MTQTLTTKVLNDFITGQGYGVAPSAVEAMARELLANREAQPVICDIERIKRHALPAGECPKQSQVVLLSSLKRLLTAPPAPAVPDEMTGDGVLAMHDCGYIEGWNACRAAMLAQPQNEPQNIPKNIPGDLPAAVNRLLDSDGSCGCFSAIRCSDAREEVERLLAQPVSQGCKLDSLNIRAVSALREAVRNQWLKSNEFAEKVYWHNMHSIANEIIEAMAAAPEGGNEK